MPIIKTFIAVDYVRAMMPPATGFDPVGVAFGFGIHKVLPAFLRGGFSVALGQFKPYFRSPTDV